jgi:hypothetical protein
MVHGAVGLTMQAPREGWKAFADDAQQPSRIMATTERLGLGGRIHPIANGSPICLGTRTMTSAPCRSGRLPGPSAMLSPLPRAARRTAGLPQKVEMPAFNDDIAIPRAWVPASELQPVITLTHQQSRTTYVSSTAC